MDYSRWDNVYDSDEERQREKEAMKRLEAAERKRRFAEQRMAAKAKKQADMIPKKADGSEMTEKDFMKQYEKMLNPGGTPKQPYKFPDTLPEQQAICDAAAALKERGNAFYAKGEYVEAAKMYEQGVLKFADWFAESFATDDEKKMVHAIKLPCHLNLAECSRRLGNHQHAVVHCTQVLEHMDAENVKALFRRGASHLRLGNLDEAHTDLKHALALSPRDPQLRAECATLKEKQREYKARTRALASRGLAGAGADDDSKPRQPADAASNPAPSGERARALEAGDAAGGEADDEGEGGEVRHDRAQAAAAAGQKSGTLARLAAIEQPATKPSAARMASVAMRSRLSTELLSEPRIVEALSQLEQQADQEEAAHKTGPGETDTLGLIGKAWQALRGWVAPPPSRQMHGLGACAALALSVGVAAAMRRMSS